VPLLSRDQCPVEIMRWICHTLTREMLCNHRGRKRNWSVPELNYIHNVENMDSHFRTIIEHSREAVIVLQQCQVQYANRAASTILATPNPLLIGADISKYFHTDDRKNIIQEIHRFVETVPVGSSEIHPLKIVDGDGFERPIKMRMVMTKWQSKSAILCYLTDMSAEMRAVAELQERDAIFNVLIGRAYNGIVVIQNNQVVYLNEQMASILGYEKTELVGTRIKDHIHSDEVSKVLDHYSRQTQGDSAPVIFESRLIHKNGRSIDVQLNAEIVMFNGQLANFVFVRDITERKQQQAALERQNRELTTLFKAATAISSDLSLDKVLEAVSLQMIHALVVTGCSISLWHEDENILETLADYSYNPNKQTEEPGTIYNLDDYPATLAVLESREPLVIRNDDEAADAAELTLMREFGIFDLLILPLIARDRVIGIVELFNEEIYHDFSEEDIRLASSLAAQAAVAVENATLFAQAQAEIVERQRAESRANRYLEQQIIVNQLALTLGQLTRLDDIYHAIYVQVNSLLLVDTFIISFYDGETEMIRAGYVNSYGRHVNIQTLPDIPLAEEGKGMQSRVIRSGLPLCVSEFADAQKYFQTVHTIRKDGTVLENQYSEKQGEITQSQLFVPMKIGGKCMGVMQVQSEQKNAYTQDDVDLLSSLANMAAIAIQNARLLAKTRNQGMQMDQIVSSVPDGVILLDAGQRLMMANPAAQEYLPLLANISFGEVLTHLGERPLPELLEAPPKGLWHEVESNGRYYDVVARAIETEQAPGGWMMVIHDVTREKEVQTRLEQQNRLAAVGQLAAGIAHDFNNIMTVINLYTDLVQRSEKQISDSARKRLEIIGQQSYRAADLIEQILDFSRRSVIERRPMDFLPFLKEVVKLLERTLIENIDIELKFEEGIYTINADPTRMQQIIMNLAVNARDAMPTGGKLSFALSLLHVNVEDSDTESELSPGSWLKLKISDNGTGIEEDVLPHVFDPFFTTKAPGQGSGLGLAQVWGIVKQHEGHISVSTLEGRGTSFLLYLPLYNEETPVHVQSLPNDVIDGSKETILVVEDNVMTREVIVECLATLNYEVKTAVNGLEAFEIMENHRDDITLVISDVVMPEMGGVSLLEKLRARGWETAVILLTGHPLNKELDEALSFPNVEWISKPVTLEQLADVVNRQLEVRLLVK
jgi:PAS domain S-box-containing protein